MADQERNHTAVKFHRPFYSPFDPCPDKGERYYSTPPHLYLGFQPPDLPQFHPKEALFKGTLWPALYDPYPKPFKK